MEIIHFNPGWMSDTQQSLVLPLHNPDAETRSFVGNSTRCGANARNSRKIGSCLWKLFSARARLLTRTQTKSVRTLTSPKWVHYEELRCVKKEFVQCTWPFFCIFYGKSLGRLISAEGKHFDLIKKPSLGSLDSICSKTLSFSSQGRFSIPNTNPYVHSAKHEKRMEENSGKYPQRGQKSSSRVNMSRREDFF